MQREHRNDYRAKRSFVAPASIVLSWFAGQHILGTTPRPALGLGEG